MRPTRVHLGVIVPIVLVALGAAERLVAQDVTANASPRRQSARDRDRAPVISTAAIPLESPLATRLARVPAIRVDTVVGSLPRLPREIPAVYRDNARGPAVRVIWPSPKDNSQVIKPGTYIVTGKVPGTSFRPTATVTVRPASSTAPVPTRTVEPFALSQVVLNQDTKGRDTPVHQESRQVHPRPGGDQSRQFSL